MLPAGFETAIPASKRTQTIALNRSATGIGINNFTLITKSKLKLYFDLRLVCVSSDEQFCVVIMLSEYETPSTREPT
jgi:hypothetical protein